MARTKKPEAREATQHALTRDREVTDTLFSLIVWPGEISVDMPGNRQAEITPEEAESFAAALLSAANEARSIAWKSEDPSSESLLVVDAVTA